MFVRGHILSLSPSILPYLMQSYLEALHALFLYMCTIYNCEDHNIKYLEHFIASLHQVREEGSSAKAVQWSGKVAS